MLKKYGINTTRAEKNGPTVRRGIAVEKGKFVRTLSCPCGAKLEKTCESEALCEITPARCPKCGRKIG